MPDWGAPGAGVESISRQLDLAKKRLIGCFSVAQGIRALGVIKNVVFPVLAGMRFLLGPALRALTQPTLSVLEVGVAIQDGSSAADPSRFCVNEGQLWIPIPMPIWNCGCE